MVIPLYLQNRESWWPKSEWWDGPNPCTVECSMWMQFLKLGFRRPQRLFVLTYVLFKHTHIKEYIYIYIYMRISVCMSDMYGFGRRKGAWNIFWNVCQMLCAFACCLNPNHMFHTSSASHFVFVFCIVFCNSYVGDSFHPCAQYRKKCLPIICRDRYIIFIYM